MSLFTRLTKPAEDEKKIPVHQFIDALREWDDGAVTRAALIAAFGISVDEETDIDWLKSRYVASANKEKFTQVVEGILRLGERGLLGYDVAATFTARVNGIG